MATEQIRSDGAPPRDNARPAAEAPNFARLAARITGWTSKCLLSAIILVAGVGFGRQILHWWGDTTGAAPAGSTVEAAGGLGDPARTHILRFGEQPWSMRREPIVGNRQAAIGRLRALCRQSVAAAPLPADEPQQAEIELLTRLAETRPADEKAGEWRVYGLEDGFPTAVGVRGVVTHAPEAENASLAGPAARVVIWGLAVPTGSETWALYTFQPDNGRRGASASGEDVPLPPGAQNILSMRTADGEAMAGFDGPGDPEAWKRHFDRWADRKGWSRVGQWRPSGGSWYVRYVAGGGRRAATVDVRFGPGRGNRLTGLVITASSPSGRGSG